MKPKFISIGSKGVALPTDLTEIRPPLVIGENSLRWANPGKELEAVKAKGWVSNNGKMFEVYLLKDAVEKERVQHFANATWLVNGKHYQGDVYYPANWKRGELQPETAGAWADDWHHGQVDRELHPQKRNKDVVGVITIPPLKVSNDTVKTPSKKWTREELLIALNLYHKLNFGQLHARQPVVIDLAEKLNRGANSVAMKLCNLASLDPALQLRGIKGLEGASALDRSVWDEFHKNLNEAAPASEEALRKLFNVDENEEIDILPKEGILVRKIPTGPTETTANVKQRLGQGYFRNAVLNNFAGRCGVTQLSIRELLIASHILRWSTHPEERLNVRNGLCLSRLHDAAFEIGLITFDDNLRLVISTRIKTEMSQRAIAENFGAYSGQQLYLPDDAFFPDLVFLAKHREKFQKN